MFNLPCTKKGITMTGWMTFLILITVSRPT